MSSLGAVVVTSLLFVGCDSGSRATQPAMGPPIDIVLQADRGLPRLHIEATFAAAIEPAPHVQPVTTVLIGARSICYGKDAPIKMDLAAALHVEVRGKRLHATAGNPTAACLARAMDGRPIDDPADYVVELVVSVG